jgi:hypothetical protein
MAGLSTGGLLTVLGGEPVRAGTDHESRVGGLRGHCRLELNLFIPAVGRCSSGGVKMTGYLDQHSVWFGCFLLAAGVGALFLLLYLAVYFAGFERWPWLGG